MSWISLELSVFFKFGSNIESPGSIFWGIFFKLIFSFIGSQLLNISGY